jgi:hypothetical protein
MGDRLPPTTPCRPRTYHPVQTPHLPPRADPAPTTPCRPRTYHPVQTGVRTRRLPPPPDTAPTPLRTPAPTTRPDPAPTTPRLPPLQTPGRHGIHHPASGPDGGPESVPEVPVRPARKFWPNFRSRGRRGSSAGTSGGGQARGSPRQAPPPPHSPPGTRRRTPGWHAPGASGRTGPPPRRGCRTAPRTRGRRVGRCRRDATARMGGPAREHPNLLRTRHLPPGTYHPSRPRTYHPTYHPARPPRATRGPMPTTYHRGPRPTTYHRVRWLPPTAQRGAYHPTRCLPPNAVPTTRRDAYHHWRNRLKGRDLCGQRTNQEPERLHRRGR